MNPIGHLFFTIIGYLYLWVRYRNHEKVIEVKKEYYEDRYAVAGAQLLLSILGVMFFVLLSIALIGTIYIILTRPPSAP